MTVHFVGAGPGAADLMTLRGRDLIASAPVCLYAGSLVPPEVLAWCPPGARLVDTANLDLDAITAELVAAHAAGLDVARLQSGDPSIYSAMAEQMRRLDEAGVPYDVTPGVPAYAAAAASLGRELTVPGRRADGDPHADLRRVHADAAGRGPRNARAERRDAGTAPGGGADLVRRRGPAARVRRRTAPSPWSRGRAGRTN